MSAVFLPAAYWYCRQGEGLPDEGFLPVAGEGGVVAVAAPQDHPAKLGDDTQGVVEDVGGGVVAIDEDGNAGFSGLMRGAHGFRAVGLGVMGGRWMPSVVRRTLAGAWMGMRAWRSYSRSCGQVNVIG